MVSRPVGETSVVPSPVIAPRSQYILPVTVKVALPLILPPLMRLTSLAIEG
jgi:hypothetical protein